MQKVDCLLPLTIANKDDRIYIDANVLVFLFYTKEHKDFSSKAKEFMKRVESRKFEGVISSLTLMEVIKSLRELLIEHAGLYEMKEVERVIRDSIGSLFSIDNICFVEGRPPECQPVQDIEKLYYYVISNECLRMIKAYTGKPDKGQDGQEIKHRGLHPPDIIHIVLAKQVHCDKIATFEWGFKETEKEIVPLVLQDNNALW